MIGDFNLVTLLPWVAVLGVAGVCAGLIAGLLGVGGGIVIVPVLFHLLSLLGVPETVKMHLAVGTSLAAIIPVSLSSLRAHWRRGAVDRTLLGRWALPIAIGVAVGTGLAGLVHGHVLTAVFAGVALLVAAHMAFATDNTRLSGKVPEGLAIHAIPFTIGGLSAMMGIGGGTLTVPTLVLCNYPVHRAIGTAAAFGLIIAIPGAVGFAFSGLDVPDRPPLSIGYVSVIGLVLIAPISTLLAPVGARVAHALSPRLLRRCFAAFLLATSLRMGYGLLT